MFNRDFIGAAAIKRSAASLYDGPDPLQAHLSFFCFLHFDAAKEVLAEAETNLRSRGIQKLVFGQDSRHFFPGCPEDWPEMMRFLLDQGFEPQNDQVDLERDLSNYEAPEGTLSPLGTDVIARPCVAEDMVALRAFFDEEFPGRWKFDVLQKWNLDGPSTVMGLFEGPKCIGFALIQQEGTSMPIGGAVWGSSLGANWGSMGPIGVSRGVRGRGLGDALLAASLLELKNRGARQTIIDWTTLIDFYGKHGFVVNRKYKSLVKPLA